MNHNENFIPISAARRNRFLLLGAIASIGIGFGLIAVYGGSILLPVTMAILTLVVLHFLARRWGIIVEDGVVKIVDPHRTRMISIDNIDVIQPVSAGSDVVILRFRERDRRKATAISMGPDDFPQIASALGWQNWCIVELSTRARVPKGESVILASNRYAFAKDSTGTAAERPRGGGVVE